MEGIQKLAVSVIAKAVYDCQNTVIGYKKRFYKICINGKKKEINKETYYKTLRYAETALRFLTNEKDLGFYCGILNIDINWLTEKLNEKGLLKAV